MDRCDLFETGTTISRKAARKAMSIQRNRQRSCTPLHAAYAYTCSADESSEAVVFHKSVEKPVKKLKFVHNAATHAVCVFQGPRPLRAIDLPAELKSEYGGPDGPVYGHDNAHLLTAVERVGLCGLSCVLVPRDAICSVLQESGVETVHVRCGPLLDGSEATMSINEHIDQTFYHSLGYTHKDYHMIKHGVEVTAVVEGLEVTWVIFKDSHSSSWTEQQMHHPEHLIMKALGYVFSHEPLTFRAKSDNSPHIQEIVKLAGYELHRLECVAIDEERDQESDEPMLEELQMNMSDN